MGRLVVGAGRSVVGAGRLVVGAGMSVLAVGFVAVGSDGAASPARVLQRGLFAGGGGDAYSTTRLGRRGWRG